MGLDVKHILKVTLLVIGLITVVQSFSTRESRAEEGSLDAHVHGMSDLTIAIEGNEIQIEFESPSMNIVGFEYKAQSAIDIETAERAAAALKQHDTVFTFIDVTCKLFDSSWLHHGVAHL